MRADVRPYDPSDRERLTDVCVRTAHRGGSGYRIYPDVDILPSLFLHPYLRLHAELASVCDGPDGSPAVGYVVGTSDTTDFVREYRRRWLPEVATRFPLPDAPAVDAPGRAAHRLHHPEYMIHHELAPCPAHLHIGILAGFRGAGLGRRLIESFVDALRDRGGPGVHVGISAANTNALAFFMRLGFRPLDVDGEPSALYLCRRTGPGRPGHAGS